MAQHRSISSQNLTLLSSHAFSNSSISPDLANPHRPRVNFGKVESSVTVRLPPPLIEEWIGRRFWVQVQEGLGAGFIHSVCGLLGCREFQTRYFSPLYSQDVHFLRAFAQAYEMAEECADDDDAKVGICELRKSVLEELKVHDSLVQEWAFDLPKECKPNAATVKYTDFFAGNSLTKSWSKTLGKLATHLEKTELAAYNLGVMTPCMRLYAFLGKELQAFLHPNEGVHPYKKWIDNYYMTFFSLGRNSNYYSTKIRSESIGNQLARMSSADLRSMWGELSKQYTEGYEQCIESILLSNTGMRVHDSVGVQVFAVQVAALGNASDVAQFELTFDAKKDVEDTANRSFGKISKPLLIHGCCRYTFVHANVHCEVLGTNGLSFEAKCSL
ncbi:hypothetical protein Pfo_027073 [Paulownia fortunei]|nr:hypothetical protein Pfo_027073 [Paulownia fortunei]